MGKLNDAEKIKILKHMKASIFLSDAVVDTLHMEAYPTPVLQNQTVVEAIDELLIDLGEDSDVLESENDFYHRASTYKPLR